MPNSPRFDERRSHPVGDVHDHSEEETAKISYVMLYIVPVQRSATGGRVRVPYGY